jgi:hypothetical protein
MNPKSFLLLSSVALLGATAAHAVTVSYDFSTAAQFTDNFTHRVTTPIANNTVSVVSGVLQQNITTGSATNAAAVYTYTPTTFALDEGVITASMSLKAPAPTAGQSTSFGIYFSDGSNDANNLLALFNVDTSGTTDTFRVFRDGAFGTGAAGTQIGTTQNFSPSVMAAGAAGFTTVSFTLSSTSVSLTVDGQTLSQSISGTDLNWTNTNVSFRSFDGRLSVDGLLQMDNFVLTGVAIPEPSTYALVAGGLCLAGVVVARRRNTKAE